MRNARRIADNEPAQRTDVDFVFVARFDCPHDLETVKYVSKKFLRTSVYTSQRRGTGWPHGCNELWSDVACRMAPNLLRSIEWQDVKAMFTFEADAIPVVPDWIDQLSTEWNVAVAKGKFIVGCLMPPPMLHINGNAMFPPDIFFRVPEVLGCSPVKGWDFAYAQFFEPHWYPTPLITNYYKDLNVPVTAIRRKSPDGRIPAIVHGVKDESVEAFADIVLRKS
jgi:hypothetical protein